MTELTPLYNANNLYNNVLKSMTSTISKEDLGSQINQKIENENERSGDIAGSSALFSKMEADAKAKSDAVGPNYLE